MVEQSDEQIMGVALPPLIHALTKGTIRTGGRELLVKRVWLNCCPTIGAEVDDEVCQFARGAEREIAAARVKHIANAR